MAQIATGFLTFKGCLTLQADGFSSISLKRDSTGSIQNRHIGKSACGNASQPADQKVEPEPDSGSLLVGFFADQENNSLKRGKRIWKIATRFREAATTDATTSTALNTSQLDAAASLAVNVQVDDAGIIFPCREDRSMSVSA